LLDTATYLKNRAPTQLLEQTPYEKLYGMKPDLSHLRTIGTLAWAMIPSEKQLCIYTKTTAAELILIAIYVDDIFVVLLL
jgi:hypothetical protein